MEGVFDGYATVLAGGSFCVKDDIAEIFTDAQFDDNQKMWYVKPSEWNDVAHEHSAEMGISSPQVHCTAPNFAKCEPPDTPRHRPLAFRFINCNNIFFFFFWLGRGSTPAPTSRLYPSLFLPRRVPVLINCLCRSIILPVQ